MKHQGQKGRGGGHKGGPKGGRGRDDRRDDRRGGHDDRKGGKPPRDRDDRGGRSRDGNRHDRPRHTGGGQHGGGHSHQHNDAPRGRASVWGLHSVREAWLNPARVIKSVWITEEGREDFAELIALADERDLDRPTPTIVDRRGLDRLTGPGAVHQGVALDAMPLEEVFVRDLISAAAGRERAIIVMLDQVTDPHNVGAIMRSASAFGAVGIVMQKRHAPELDGVLLKTASGAGEHIPVAYETNLSRTLEELQEEGFTALALDERGDISLEELPAYDRAVIVMGAEGPGIRRLVKEHCDRLVRLPTGGPVGVLNVSNAAAVTLYALATAKKK
jgi:23S rRNA (guanosine2251-2'-O)-methyltransferase